MSMLKIEIILGSTRPNRVGETVANWVSDTARMRSDAEFELVDIAKIGLPFFDEVMPELQVATVRNQLILNSYTDFENFYDFKPTAQHVGTLNAVFDQMISWGAALRPVRG